ncbi:hypothetical protein EQ856_09110 [Enterococcus hirae]|uniref:hypothetical protein n=1 Tax=Enterococcus TaxID=1350 RepID=UPI00046E50A8|nr:hypothetical protein [Enterococcus hirae]EMF0091750.1 hypothetical protein [Enterococcus hirae]EMF0094565.1 hypothetical protein [Enterococcus hirae]EMF0128844.1 hypothetical protein [Enterococcus hirae]EMF0157736.1 hypothetical protein [Enterococcus hirae]EMF0175420.1 hypothetical protein [Enterococcus hirae]
MKTNIKILERVFLGRDTEVLFIQHEERQNNMTMLEKQEIGNLVRLSITGKINRKLVFQM